MAPPTTVPRLKNIDPETFGLAVNEGVLAHLNRLAFALGVDARQTSIPNLQYSVRDLAAYAVKGERLDAPVEDYFVTICPPVWMRAADSGIYQTPEFDESNIDVLKPGWLGELVLVMRAALARQSIEQGQDVGLADVAALASVSSMYTRNLMRTKDIKAKLVGDVWKISAKEARRWLTARGVPGFEGGTK